MNFKVLWQPLAQEWLATLLADPAVQGAVLRSVFRIEALLEYFPDQVGESREALDRVLIDRPLTVYYEIDHQEKVVRVFRLLAKLPEAPDSDD